MTGRTSKLSSRSLWEHRVAAYAILWKPVPLESELVTMILIQISIVFAPVAIICGSNKISFLSFESIVIGYRKTYLILYCVQYGYFYMISSTDEKCVL